MAMNNSGVNVVRAGYLHRRSGVLKKWKRQWFVLSDDGILRFFEGELSSNAVDAARMKVDCNYINTGHNVRSVTPPSGLSNTSLMEISFKSKSWILCADTSDDMEAWRIALEDSRLVNSAGSTTTYIQQSATGYAPATVIQQQSGQTTTYIQQTNGPSMVIPPQQNGAYPVQQPNTAYPVQHQNGAYPVQSSVHTYPGQQIVYSDPNQTVYAPQAAPMYGNGTTVVQGGPYGPNHTTVYVNNNDPNNPNRQNNGGDMAMGFMAGAAMGSMMYGPVLFW